MFKLNIYIKNTEMLGYYYYEDTIGLYTKYLKRDLLLVDKANLINYI